MKMFSYTCHRKRASQYAITLWDTTLLSIGFLPGGIFNLPSFPKQRFLLCFGCVSCGCRVRNRWHIVLSLWKHSPAAKFSPLEMFIWHAVKPSTSAVQEKRQVCPVQPKHGHELNRVFSEWLSSHKITLSEHPNRKNSCFGPAFTPPVPSFSFGTHSTSCQLQCFESAVPENTRFYVSSRVIFIPLMGRCCALNNLQVSCKAAQNTKENYKLHFLSSQTSPVKQTAQC